ncbi:hypothetical protein SAMN02746066_02847 [Anaerosporobacter mobilis DSM 15930]|uniref:Prenyltransferase and squalene oxidase repeat-containing protein n=1 Tax=Anaerosporobacter mobilis DSM 15930 TaxID=1120996 RepID=A0A1M7KNF5_9FIRM|nr:hypothetical protein [Anaerosporobacter mobilis]SHM67028.1 hypothetical protein SAMN02746066_02847 [Anaerosporobacter mobilis DSM 15930]
MKKLSKDHFIRLRKLVYRNARPLDFTKWKYLFENGSCEDFLSVLSSYQNEDGGFGYNIECNNWNPNSSPYTVCIALDYLDTTGDYVSSTKDTIIMGIIKYLASGIYLLENGWVGMQGIPSNNDFAHLPWFHFDPNKATEADIGVTKRLSDFILKYADESSDIYHKAVVLKDKYKLSGQILLNGVPDYDPVSLEMKSFNPATWPFWLPLPVYFVGSPNSKYYPELKHVVDINLDSIINTLQNTNEIQLAPEEELNAFEQNNPHPDGKRWCVAEQAIGNYYWGTHNITSNLDILRKFDRLDFHLLFTQDEHSTKTTHC